MKKLLLLSLIIFSITVGNSTFANNYQQNYYKLSYSNEKQIKETTNIKQLKKKYSEISTKTNIIEACELLKNSTGEFSYKSIHGNNTTTKPIRIIFTKFTEKTKPQFGQKDAYGEFKLGKPYTIKINSIYKDSPAEALAPIIAREALASKDKTDSDFNAAKELQAAIWAQITNNNPSLRTSKEPLCKLNTKLLKQTDYADYSSFYETTRLPDEESIIDTTENEKGFTNKKFFPNFLKKKNKINENLLPTEENEAQNKATETIIIDSKELQKKYKKITEDDRIIEALELMGTCIGKFSQEAILGNNLTHKPIKVEFKDLSSLSPKYASFDALGWRQHKKLTIYISHKHVDAPAAALAALLSHEALHQDEFDSLNEETYAWSLEAAVWIQLCDKNPNLEEISHPLVTRENLLKKLFEKGDYSMKYIKKSVFSNPSYSNLPMRSPGFEDNINEIQ